MPTSCSTAAARSRASPPGSTVILSAARAAIAQDTRVASGPNVSTAASVRRSPCPRRRPMATEAPAAPPIVLVHGLWLTPRSWEGWKDRFEAKGREVHAPAWPRMGEVEDMRRDPSPLNGLGVQEIVDHYDAFIRG